MGEQRKALVVATDHYDDEMLNDLAAPAADAAALADVLSAQDLGAFDVALLTNPTMGAALRAAVALLERAEPSDFLLLHFSCHGIKDQRGELYLAARDTEPDLLAATAIDAANLNRLMLDSPAQRIVLLLDCCYGGAFARGLAARAGGDVDVVDHFTQSSLAAGRGRVVITASTAMQYSFEHISHNVDGQPRPSLFTGALVEGIRSGDADRDHDGRVAIRELYDHVHERVQRLNAGQSPSKWEFGLQGDFYIAANPHWRVRPVPPPDAVIALARNESASLRLEAVRLLERRACGSDLGPAAGARDLLRILDSDDSPDVSAAAARVLAKTAVQIKPTRHAIGQVHTGDLVEVEAEILGGSLAEASAISCTLEGAQAAIQNGVLRVDVATDKAGPVDGVVTLDGPAGTATLHITGVVQRSAVQDREGISDETEAVSTLARPTVARTGPVEPEAHARPLFRDELGSLEERDPGLVEQPTEVRAVWLRDALTDGTAAQPSAPKRQATARGVIVGALVLGASMAMVVSYGLFGLTTDARRLVPGSLVVDGVMHVNPTDDGSTWLLGLSVAVVLLVPSILRRRHLAVALATILAAALWDWLLAARVFAATAARVGIGQTSTWTFDTTLWLRFTAAALLSTAAALLLHELPDIRARVTSRADRRAVIGALVVAAGAAFIPVWAETHIERADDGSFAEPMRAAGMRGGGWSTAAILIVVFVLVSILRLNQAQRRVALLSTVVFFVLAAARSLVLAPQTPENPPVAYKTTVLALAIVTSGVFVSHLRREDVLRGLGIDRLRR
jgi:hypothetical protein